MPAKESIRKSRESKPAAVARKQGYWELSLAPFLDRWAVALLCLILMSGCLRIAATYNALSVTFDEPIHFACGLEYLTNHAYRLESQHPPLERAMGALLPYLTGMRTSAYIRNTPRVPDTHTANSIREKEVPGLLPAGPKLDRMLVLMRLGVLPFFVMASLVVYEWARHAFGKPAAVLSAAIFTLIPTVLAHAGVATTDIGLTACLGGAFLFLLRWAEQPTPKRAVVAGIWTALSVLCKFTTLIYLPAATAAAVLALFAVQRPRAKEIRVWTRQGVRTFPIAVATGALVIWAGYWFSFGAVPGWPSALRVPAPELFDGIRSVLEHNAGGHRSFLLGENSMKGWWYFFPVALSVKTPLAILLLLPIGLFACWRLITPWRWMPVALVAGVLLPAMAGHINIGVRHVLPVYMGFAIIAALGLIQLSKWGGGPVPALLLPGILIAWTTVSGVLQHPDYLAYFNAVAGDRPEAILVDSDLDWGQGMKLLAARLKKIGAPQVSLYLWITEFSKDDYVREQYGIPPIKPFEKIQPNAGWNVVSPTRVGIIDGGWYRPTQTKRFTGVMVTANAPWFEFVAPTERVGALLLYNIPPGFYLQ